MPYKIIPGEFRLFYKIQRHVGSRPDGDSMWFKPADESNLVKLGERSISYNKGGFAQLRFEGIDALELHYKGSNHQKLPECVDARDRLLSFGGFTDIEYAPSSTADIDTAVRDSTPLSIPGYILTRGADIYGRPVAFVYTGQPPAPNYNDGFWLDDVHVSESLNAKLIHIGHAYPSFYSGLPTELRTRLKKLWREAESDQEGLWKVDSSMTEMKITDIGDLSNLAIWPKLYRRLFSFYKDGNTDIGKFETWIRDPDHDRDDEIWILDPGELGNFHDIFEVENGELKMIVEPDNMVIVPR